MTDFEQYKQFLADADRDDRVGDQDAVIVAIEEGAWPSGDAYKRVRLNLTTAGGAKADFNINPLPSAEEIAASGSWETGRKRGVAQGINMHKAIEKFYGKSADELAVGDTIRIKCVKNKEGFIRVAAILDPAAKSEAKAAAPKSDVPF